MLLLIVYVSLALGVSFLCSIMEAALLSVTPSFVLRLEEARPVRGRRLRALKENVDRPLAAILSLNTIAHTVGATGAGAQAVAVFGSAYVGIISGLLTLLILVISEIIPKTLGAVYWRQLMPALVPVLQQTMRAMAPLVWLAEFLTKVLAPGQSRVQVDREDFRAMAELGEREGILGENESRILRNLFRFGQLQARDIMTPRTVLFGLEAHLTVAEVLAGHPELRFSRIPIFDESRDDASHFVLKSDLLLKALRCRGDTTLEEMQRPLPAVPESATLHQLFDRLIGEEAHIALVRDEYGGTVGIVTLEDLLETLIGLEIVDEEDPVVDMRELARQQWKRRARLLGLDPDQ
ncbi:MAG: hemolysin family protein [Planctomycetota bacterium]